MSISCDFTPLENATKELKELKGRKDKLPEYLQLRQAWKVFGKWMVAIGESDQNQVNMGGYEKSGHVCIVLRGIGFTFYFYELIGTYSPKQYKIFDYMRLIFDRILITNQCVSHKLKFYLQKEGWKGSIFPRFFKDYPVEEIVKYSDIMDEDINEFSNVKYVYKKVDRKKYHNDIISPADPKMKFDIKGCYAELLSILNTIKPTLPQDNIMIVDDLIGKCEHGYYLGFLLEKALDGYAKTYPNTERSNVRGRDFLQPKLKNFIKGREDRVTTASKEAFGLTPEVIKRLNRMFIYREVQ
jgi:hypothetical protein